MSKSRRDLSLVAIAALVASSFAMSAPAQAAGELKIEPTTGTVAAVPHGDVISLKVSATGGNDSDELLDLKYALSTDGTFDVKAKTGDSGVATLNATRAIDRSENEDKGVVTADTYTAGDNVNVITLAVDNDGELFDVTASTKRVTVVAFVDKDNSNTPDSDEWQATTDVDFVDFDDVTFTNVLSQPVLGDTSIVNTVSDANINLAQSSLATEFLKNSGDSKVISSGATTRTYSSSRDDLKFSSEASPYDDVQNGTYSATVFWTSTVTTSATTRLGTASTRDVDQTTVSQVSGTAVRSEFNTVIEADDTTDKLKSGSGSLTYVVEVTTSADVAIADKTVSLKIFESGNTSLDKASVTVGSVTLTNDSNSKADSVTATATTGADGKASFAISYSDLDKTEKFKIQASVDGVDEDAVELEAEDAKPDDILSANVINTNEDLVVSTGSSFDLTYHVLTQFGALYTGSNASVSVTVDSGNSYTGTVTNGAATVSIPALSAGSKAMVADVDVTSGTDSALTFTHDVTVGSPNDVSGIRVTAGDFGTSSAPLNLNSKSTARADIRFGQHTTDSNADITNGKVKVTDVNGNGTQSQVTFSGENLIFEVDAASAGEVYSPGSITVWTDSNGEVDFVDISSQYAGKQVLTVTAGGQSATKDIYFGAVGADAGDSLSLDMPATAAPGSTFQVTGTLVDAFGNPVQVTTAGDISVTYTGPGIAFGNLPDKTDANGQFKFAVLLGTNDTGSGTVTASYDQNSDDDFTDAKDISVSKSINNGSGTFTGTYGEMSAWTVNQDDGTAKVYVKFPTIGEKVRIGHQTGGSGSYETIYVKTTSSETMDGLRQVAGVGTYVVRTIDLEDGTNRIRVTVGDSTEVQVRYNE